jgi:dihydroneopterin aldolase
MAVPVRTETRFLASVRDDAEASIALEAGADLIDFKEPSAGASVLSIGVTGKAVRLIAGRAKTSATVGDLPMEAGLLCEAVTKVGASGVDYVKLGAFRIRTPKRTPNLPVARQHKLILVLFADAMPDFDAWRWPPRSAPMASCWIR